VPRGDLLLSMIGLLYLGKSDYADIETCGQEEFFRRALGLKKAPSEETLRQRMDQLGATPIAMLHEQSARMIARHAPARRLWQLDSPGHRRLAVRQQTLLDSQLLLHLLQ